MIPVYFTAAGLCGAFSTMFWSFIIVNIWTEKRLGGKADPRRMNTALGWAVSLSIIAAFFIAMALRKDEIW